MGNELIGQAIGRYQILEQLGEGGMATVYKARDTNLNRDVAIKVIRTDIFGPAILQRLLERFKREGQALAELTHPNIVTVLEFGEHAGAPYLVMPYFPGGTLKSQLQKPLPYLEAVRLLIPIAQALAHAHAQGIVHRDVKPANILITSTGEPMLSDFGIAKLLDNEETRELTGAGVGVGTPEYMSPEQGMGQTDERADIYALGIVLYELITGQIPYRADTPMALLIKKREEPLPRPKQYIPGLPDPVENVLVKALARDSGSRYQTAREFVEALENLSHGKADTGLSRRKKNQIMTAVAIGVLILFTVVFGLQYAGRAAALLPEQTNTPAFTRTAPPSMMPTEPSTPVPATSTDLSPTLTPTVSPTAEFMDCAYKIQGGDTLSSISTRFGVAMDAVRDVNGTNLLNPNLLAMGQELLILNVSTKICSEQNSIADQGSSSVIPESVPTFASSGQPVVVPVAPTDVPPIPYLMPTLRFAHLQNGDVKSMTRDLIFSVDEIPNAVLYQLDFYQDGGFLYTWQKDSIYFSIDNGPHGGLDSTLSNAVAGNLYVYGRAQINVYGELRWTEVTPLTITLIE